MKRQRIQAAGGSEMCMSQEEKESFEALVEESEETKTIAQRLLNYVRSGKEVPKLKMVMGGFPVPEPSKP